MAGGNQIVIECDPLWLKAIATVYCMDCPSAANRTRSPGPPAGRPASEGRASQGAGGEERWKYGHLMAV